MSTKSFIKTHDKSIAVIIGVKDLIIINEKDALLVTKKNSHTNIKDVLNSIKKKKKKSLNLEI